MEELKKHVIKGASEEVTGRVKILLEQGVNAETIMHESLIPAMDEVGDLFQKGEFFLPEMIVAARAMQDGMAVIKPLLAEKEHKPEGSVVIGTVSGDLHDIGKNLVVMLLEGAGLEVIDLGIDVTAEKFVEAVKKYEPNVLGLSALLTTTMLKMKETVEAVEEAGLRSKVKIMIGGAPVTGEFADEIGADFHGADAGAGKNYACEVIKNK